MPVRFRLLLCIVCLMPALSAGREAASVSGLRYGLHDQRGRIVIETDRPIEVALQVDGRTLALKLPGIDPASLSAHLASDPPESLPLVASHRLDTGNPAEPALLIELHEPSRTEYFTLGPMEGHEHRAVVDLVPITPRDGAAGDRKRSSLEAVRIGRHGERTRIVFESQGPIDFEVGHGDGERVVAIALDGIDPAELRHAISGKTGSGGPLLERLTVADRSEKPGALLVHLAREVTTRAFQLQPEGTIGHRLVIDLSPAGTPSGATPAARERKPSPTVTGASSASRPAAAARQAQPEWLWLETTLNRRRQRHTILVLRTRDGFHMTEDDLRQWDLRVPDRPDLAQGGERWFRLGRMGLEAEFNERRLTLNLEAPATAFVGHTFQPDTRPPPAPTPPGRGLFLNYDVALRHGDGDMSVGGLFELGAFGGLGSLTSDAVANDGGQPGRKGFTRLDTRWRRDDHSARRSLVIGDTVTAAPAWAGNVRFGGVSWGNNFELHPQLVTMPLLSMTGQADLPSTIELYVDDALRMRESVEPGPFDIESIPVVTGSGQARLVVTDLLGRQRVITRSFYASPGQLRKGLHDWNIALGAQRENYGRESFDYGQALISGTHRFGMSDSLTTTLHAHLTESHAVAGGGASWLLPTGGILSADGALSRGEDANGWYASIALQRQGDRYFGGIQAAWSSPDFRRLGLRPERAAPQRELQATLSARRILGGTIGLSYTQRGLRDRDDVELAALRYSRRLGRAGFVHLSAAHDLARDETAIDLRFTIPLGQARTSADVSLSRRGGTQGAALGLRRGLPLGRGIGYDLQLSAGDGRFQRGSLSWQSDHGRWQVEASHHQGRLSGRLQASGGLLRLGGETYASRPLRDSFAVVEVGDYPDVRIYADNQKVGRTDERGRLLVPGLRPYELNRLRIEQADLPLGANVDGLAREIIPRWRSGVLAAFPVSRSRDGLFRIVLESGRPLPSGALVLDADDRAWPVGREGRVFVTGLAQRNRFRVQHDDLRCSFEIAGPEGAEPLPDLGTVICRSAR